MKSNTTEMHQSPSKADLEKSKKLNDLIAKQGVLQTATFDHLLGQGAKLWKDEDEFNKYLESMKSVRHEKG